MAPEEKNEEKKEYKEISMKFSKNLAKSFTGKDGKEYYSIQIPNQDPEDKRSWEEFVLPSYKVHEDKSSDKCFFAKVPAEGQTTLTRAIKPETPEGEWGKEERKVDNKELKKLVEAYKEEQKEISMKFSKKLARTFTGKDGIEFVAIQIPNQDPEDKRPWEEFVLPSYKVHEDQYSNKCFFAKVPEEGQTTLTRAIKPETPEGEWGKEERKVDNKDLKKLVESYKDKNKENKER